MAANVVNYKGLQVVDNAQNSAGQDLTNNFKALADNIPKTNIAASNPTVNSDTSAGYDSLSRWMNSSTKAVYVCVDPKLGAAQWVRQNDLSADTSPTLSADLNCGNFTIKGNITSDTATALFTVAGDVELNKAVDFQGHSVQQVDSILFTGGHTITASEIQIGHTWNPYQEQDKVKLGPIRWPNRPGYAYAPLTTLANAGKTQWGCLPAGTIMPWAGAQFPKWCLYCDGSAVSRKMYAALFAVIGTNFGAGDGSTTFNLPNFRGRVPIGRDTSWLGSSGWGSNVSIYYGELTHALTLAELPSHSHTMNTYNSFAAGCVPRYQASNTNQNVYGTCTGASGSCTGVAHENLPPYQTVNYIIFTGA